MTFTELRRFLFHPLTLSGFLQQQQTSSTAGTTITDTITDTSRGQNDVETGLLPANYSKWSDNASSTGSDNGSFASPSLTEEQQRQKSSWPGGSSSTTSSADTMSTPGVSGTTANKLSQAEAGGFLPHSTPPLPNRDEDVAVRDFVFDGRSAAHFTDYGIDVREELRTADHDDGDDAVNGSDVATEDDGPQSISIKSRLEVSNLINGDPIGQQQQESGGGVLLTGRTVDGSVAGNEEVTVEVGEEERLDRKSTSLLEVLDLTAASSTPIVNHFAGGGGQQPPLPLNMDTDRNSSRGGVGGGNEYLSSRNYNSSDSSGNSGSINNKSVFNESTRVEASSSFSASSATSPEHDTSSSTAPLTPKTATSTLRPCKYHHCYSGRSLLPVVDGRP